ncbi:ribonuclease P protein component [Streptococcus chenjunshii]|uniref:Ribonuclease P protein component n=1 Tax=Streptococcus chenjunshii TaxID=2173853 RepID=A0A372KIY4_9STRE|nr:ribonuclease P protein component [Streptococcus chenjunshii]AXQ77867.1 ribonuclease P protein component [Streptococcus chenjunshii]RFU50005.1 ribonuclease P protein component [Streptococcus chenjunshii]RFU52210.1 ribonuclease P protein component [Streptococcus chenjunshii]
MKKTYRVKSDKDFQAIFDHGQNAANRKFVVYRLAKQQPHYRVGISVGKKIGNAVTRNAVKRKIRHVLMEFDKNLAADDFIIIARKGTECLDYHEIKKNLRHVLKLAKLYQEGLDSEKKN